MKPKRTSRNPMMGTGVYYPSCSPAKLYVFHGVSARLHYDEYRRDASPDRQNRVATEEAFRTIWEQGAVFSSVMRQRLGIVTQSSMVFGMDRASGDGNFVFSTVCKPHSAGSTGYNFVFDPYRLVEDGAIVGIDDLQGLYMSVADAIGVQDRNDETTWLTEEVEFFQESARSIQEVWRLKGREAIEWLEWVQGVREACPLNIALLRWIDREFGGRHHNTIRWITTNRKSAADRAELLVRDQLSLSQLSGVIFRGDWYEIEEFVNIYGEPGTTPPEAMDISDAWLFEGRRGVSMRCPRCDGWMNLRPLEIGRSSWGMSPQTASVIVPGEKWPFEVVVCKSCGAAFKYRMDLTASLTGDEYVGQYEDLERSFR